MLNFLPEAVTEDLDIGRLQKLPGNFINTDTLSLREIYVDSVWSADYLPGKRRPRGTPVLMIELMSHPYPRVAQRLRHYAWLLSPGLSRGRCLDEDPAHITTVLLYNGLPRWAPRSLAAARNGFDFTFIDVGRLRSAGGVPHRLATAFSASETALHGSFSNW